MNTFKKKLFNKKYSILTIGFLAISLLIFGYEIPYIFKSNSDMNHQDFQWFYYAFHVLWDQHSPHLLYDMTYEFDWIKQQGYIIFDGIANKYVYPPQFAVLLSWFALLPIRQADILWNILALSSYLAVIYMLIQIAYKGSKLLPKLFLIALGLSFKAFYLDLISANSNWLILFCITLSFYLYDRNKIKWASIPLAIAITFKVMPILIVGYFLWRRKWDYVLYTFVSSVVITLFTWLLVGYEVLHQYVVTFLTLTSESMLNGGAPYNSSLKGVLMLTSLTNENINLIFLIYLFFFALMVLILPDLKRMIGNRFDFMIAAMCTIWFSPMVESEHLLITLIAFIILSGILIEKYTEGSVPLSLGTGEKWGIVFYWSSMALVSTYIGDRMNQYFPTHYFFSIHFMLISIMILTWKLNKVKMSTVPQKDYLQMVDAHA